MMGELKIIKGEAAMAHLPDQYASCILLQSLIGVTALHLSPEEPYGLRYILCMKRDLVVSAQD